MTASEVPAQTAAGSAPDDVQQLEQEIAATRERLGEAVEELVAKLDVKSQAKARVNRLKGQALSRAAQVKNQASAGAARAKGQVTAGAARARERAVGAAPAPARHAAATGASVAQRRPVQLAGAGAVGLLIAGLVALLLRRRKRGKTARPLSRAGQAPGGH